MSVTPPSPIPVSIDYTSKDYYALRSELIARIQDRIPEWTASDPADFGVALVEAFSYLGDIINYYIDRNANESFINTAIQRKSVLNLAQNYGYIPAGYRQATTTLTFTNSSGSAVTIPSGTVVSGDVVISDTVQTVYFSTTADVTVAAAVSGVPGTNTVTATHGRYVTIPGVSSISDSSPYAASIGQKIGVSTGTPGMTFELLETPVVDGSISLYVQDGNNFSKWTQVQHLLDYNQSALVFNSYLDENDIVTITFGDGVSGVIPTLYSEIRAQYIVGGGTLGNIAISTIDSISYIPGLSESQTTAVQAAISVTNSAVGLGGSDPESTDLIRFAAPLSIRANNRAVTMQDYADLSLAVTGVGKSNATAAVWTSVTVYIAPVRSTTDVDPAPGLDSLGNPTVEFTTLKSNVETYLQDKTLLGTSVTIQPPTYVDLKITITYKKLAQYTTTELDTAIKSKLLSVFGYTGMNFGQTIYPQDIEYVLAQIPGILNAKVTLLYKNGLTISSAAGDGTNVVYTLSDNPSFGVGSVVTVTGLTPSGYNVTNATVTAVGTNTFTVANTTTGSSSGTGAFTGQCVMAGDASEIFRFIESNVTVSGS